MVSECACLQQDRAIKLEHLYQVTKHQCDINHLEILKSELDEQLVYLPLHGYVLPRSLCAVDRSLYIPTDKASLMHAIVSVQAQQIESMLSSTPEGQLTHIKVIDAMGVLHTIK